MNQNLWKDGIVSTSDVCALQALGIFAVSISPFFERVVFIDSPAQYTDKRATLQYKSEPYGFS